MTRRPRRVTSQGPHRRRRLLLEGLEMRLLLAGDLAELSGVVWQDLDGDANRDAGENGVAGRVVYLDQNLNRQLDHWESHARTDANGSFRFGDLEPGHYSVRQLSPNGWEVTAPVGGHHAVHLAPGAVHSGVEFGTQRVWGSLLGVVWEDTDGDGKRGGDEPGVSGWPVFLDGNANGQFDEGEQGTISGEHGHFHFPDLEPGSYRIVQLPREGWQPTQPSNGVLIVELGRGDLISGLSLGSEPVWGVIEGLVWQDNDADNQFDTDEQGLAGWTVFLDDNGNGAVDDGEHHTTTDETGSFRLIELDEGNYQLSLLLPDGWERTDTDVANAATVEVEKGKVSGGVQIGAERVLGTISGLVWQDLNKDALQNEGEAGISNWVLFLDDNANNSLDEGERHTETDSDGRYSFEGLAAGVYTVAQVVSDGWQATVANVGARVVELARGALVDGINFSNDRRFGSIKGMVWQDQDRDANRSEEEEALAGRVIFIDTNRNGQLDSGEPEATTGQHGEYGFDQLEPGSYAVTQNIQTPWRQSYPRQGPHVVVVEYEAVEKVDFGNYTFTNPHSPLDVNNDGKISPSDLLHIINELNEGGARGLPAEGEAAGTSAMYIDTNGDGRVTAADALNVINYLNTYHPVGSDSEPEGEGEGGTHRRAPAPSESDIGSDRLLLPFSPVSTGRRPSAPQAALDAGDVDAVLAGDNTAFPPPAVPSTSQGSAARERDDDQTLDEWLDDLLD